MVLGFLIWKWSDDCAKRKQRIQEREWEEADKNRRISIEEQANSPRYKKDKLQEQKLKFLLEFCYDGENKKVKTHDSENVKQYLGALDEATREIPAIEKK